jgi:glyoxylate reductase
MQPGAIVINTARGGLIDHVALLEALSTGHLAGAGLDVTEPEPLPEAHPLLRRDDVIVTPHVAAATREGKDRLYSMAIDQAIAVLDGQSAPNIVNPEVIVQGGAE